MRKVIALYAGFTLLAVLILLPVTRSVNTTVGNPVFNKGPVQADGAPVPPFPPKQLTSAATLVADGAPVPPFPPKQGSTSVKLSVNA